MTKIDVVQWVSCPAQCGTGWPYRGRWDRAAAAGKAGRGRRSGAHGDAGAHDAHARERGAVAVDAAADRHDVVGLRRDEAAEGHIVHVIVRERLPDIALGAIVQLDRPGGAG